MSDIINVEEILKRHAPVLWEKVYSKDTRDGMKKAIKEIIEAVVDEYAIVAEKESPRVYSDGKSYPIVDGQTADKIKKLVKYE